MDYIDIDFPYDEADNYLTSNNKNKFNRFFYKGDIFETLKKDTTYYLIGDKGSGKTAYSVYYCNNNVEGNIHSKIYQLTVDDYNKIIQMKADHKLDYTNYVTLWKAIILIKICSSISSNEVSLFGKKGFKKIENLLKRYKFTEFTLDSFSPTSFMDSIEFSSNHSLEIEKSNINPSISQSKTKSNQVSYEKSIYTDNWVTFINEITDEISKLRLSNNHYLFIDGIDSRPSDIDFESYSSCVYPLIRAVYEVNTTIFSRIKDRNKGRLQIILLSRLDIFLQAGLSNPGSKLRDNCAYIDWNTKDDNYENSKIYSLVNNILSQQDNTLNWKSFFDYNISRGNDSFYSFTYFLRLTTGKPRDFIKILKILQELCKHSNNQPDAAIIEDDEFQKAYSTYFIDKLRTALSFTYKTEEIDELFSFLRSLGKRYMKKSELEIVYNNYNHKDKLIQSFKDFNGLLKLLFDNDMICVREKNGIFRWKYKETSVVNYNYNLPIDTLSRNTRIVFNWALEKGFSMYIKM